jgi:5-methylthioadenosine/S-adenosylhomocysteine deaminase
MKHIIINNCKFIGTVPVTEEFVIRQGTIVIQGSQIIYAGPEPWNTLPDDEIIDGRDKLFMPGLVNTHGHAAMSLLRGIKDDVNLQTWLQDYMWPLENKFKAEDVRSGAMLAILEMVKGGTTTFMDMYDHMEVVAQAVEETGMRACLCRGIIGLCSDQLQVAKLTEAIQFAKTWHGAANGRITTAMAPHAPYTCPPHYIQKIVDAAHDLQLPIHTHLSESLREVQEHESVYGLRPVEHMVKLGVFSRPCLIAHGVHLDDNEISILAKHSVSISHNPGSNLKLASGIARLPALLKAGITVSIGTDSAASNNNLDMFEEMRLTALIHKGVTGDPTVIPAAEAIRMGTRDGARSLWMSDVGMIQVGMKADLIAINLNAPHFQPAANLLSHVVYSSTASDVTDVWVDGEALVRNGICQTMDEERIIFEANQAILRIRG